MNTDPHAHDAFALARASASLEILERSGHDPPELGRAVNDLARCVEVIEAMLSAAQPQSSEEP